MSTECGTVVHAPTPVRYVRRQGTLYLVGVHSFYNYLEREM